MVEVISKLNYYNSVIKQPLDNWTFIQVSIEAVKKSIQPTVLKSSLIKITILALKRRLTVKDMAACSTEELALFNNLRIRKQDLEKPRLLLESCLPLNPQSPQNFRCPHGRV